MFFRLHESSLSIMPAVDTWTGHRFIGTFGHLLRCNGKLVNQDSRNVQVPGFAGWRWIGRFACNAATSYSVFYRIIFHKRSQGTNFNAAGILPASSLDTTGAREPARQAASYTTCKDVSLDGRFPRLPAYGGTHRSDGLTGTLGHGCDGHCGGRYTWEHGGCFGGGQRGKQKKPRKRCTQSGGCLLFIPFASFKFFWNILLRRFIKA